MSLRIVIPGARRPSRIKSLALAAFSLVRTAQSYAVQAPVAAKQAANDIADAWRESGDSTPKKA